MNRRDPYNPPRPGMIWSEKHKLWTDPDTRSPETKERHERIAKEIEARMKKGGKERGHQGGPDLGG